MGLFDDVLLTADFDRTLTGPDSVVPQRNIDAIRYFMDNGGKFTVNTGRSMNTFKAQMDLVPTNAPLLLLNGSARYDRGQFENVKTIDLPMWPVLEQMVAEFPEMNLEIQTLGIHYLIHATPEYEQMYRGMGWEYEFATPGQDLGPFIKFALFGHPHYPAVGSMFDATADELATIDRLHARIEELWGDKVVVFRAAPRIVDVQTKGVSKSVAARTLQKELGRKLLVCVGDAENDIAMLDGADYAFCPADGVVADRYETVCNCAEGAVADVIYEKIPEILKNQP